MRLIYFTIVLFLFSLSPCFSQNCLPVGLPERFSEDWKNDSLGEKKIRIGYLKSFRPYFSSEDDLRLKGIAKKCVIHSFGKPESIIQTNENVEIYIYFLNLEWIDENDSNFFQGTTFEVLIEKNIVKSYSIMVT